MNFADLISDRADRIHSCLVVGIDPDYDHVLAPSSPFRQLFPGRDEEYVLAAFCEAVLSAVFDIAVAVKPQAAFFEAAGLSGLKSLAYCVRKAREMGIPVIMDAKRGDIGNTARAYAKAYLNPNSEFFSDALTVNPYLGPDSLEPFVQAAKEHGCGIFVLVRTSNPGSGSLQTLETSGGLLFTHVARMIRPFAEQFVGVSGLSSIGAVVGATYPGDFHLVRQELPNSVLLLPGYGAQGATASDTKQAFLSGGKGALVASSRGIIFSYEKHHPLTTLEEVLEAIRDSARKSRDELWKVATGA